MPSSTTNYYTRILFSFITLTKIAPRILMHAYFFPKTERRTLGHVITFNGGINTLGMQFQHLCHSFGIYHCFLRKWISCINCTVKWASNVKYCLAKILAYTVVSHLPNIATLRRGTHFSTCTDVVWSWRPRLPALATLRRGTHFSTCTDVVWSWRPRLPALNEVLSPVLPLTDWVSMFYFMEYARLVFHKLLELLKSEQLPAQMLIQWTLP
jgi:hypothetical protein